ncbi:hypothetical protein D3C87_2005100 [compost metagenome]
MAVEQRGNSTVAYLFERLRAGLYLPIEHATDITADQVEAMGAVAQQLAFEQDAGHHLGDLGIGAGLFK